MPDQTISGETGRPCAPSFVNALLASVRAVLKEAWRLGHMTEEERARACDVKSVRGTTLPAGRSLTIGEKQALSGVCVARFDPSSDAREMIEEAQERERQALEALLTRCESPVEQMLLVALWTQWRCRVSENGLGVFATLGDGLEDASGGTFRVVVEPQKPIHVGAARYRADFFVYLLRPGDPRRIHHSPLVVEVDGHEFHERSKFQAARDRKRDRGMVLEGFQVIRFSGSEVYNGAEQCAGEVDALVRKAAGGS